MSRKDISSTKSSGFTLIELLVVVAILGIISAIGVTAYSGYVDGAKKKSVENIMQQISLAQSEYKADYDEYVVTGCGATEDTSLAIEKMLFGLDSSKKKPELITDDLEYYMCIETADTNFYNVIAKERVAKDACVITLSGKSLGISRGSNC